MDFYFAPMEGITGYPFRNAHHLHFPGMSRYYTPFLNLHHTLAFSEREKRDIAPENNAGVCVIPQVMTNRPEEFLWAAGTLADRGYREVNLNLGCPSGTVVSKGRGAGFLADPEALDAFFETVFRQLPEGILVSVKTRIGISDPSEADALLAVFNRYPLAELIIHPRVRKDFYRNAPNLEVFARMLADSKNPVCYNGDIRTEADLAALMSRFPSLKAVMIGRGLLSDPALVMRFTEALPGDGQMQQEAANVRLRDRVDGWVSHPSDPQLSAFHDTLIRNYLEEIPEWGNVLFKLKELWSYLGASFPGKEKALKHIRKARSRAEYESAVNDVFS